MINPFKNLTRPEIQGFRQMFLPVLLVSLISFALSALIWTALVPLKMNKLSHSTDPKTISLFAANYPANGSFQKELVEIKNRKELKEADELEIQRSLLATTEYLDIPPALLWCLLFQESRLNHLEGIDADKPASGLGQFSRFSFYEINHQLPRYSPDTLNLLFLTFGRDIRPIAAKRMDPLSLSSYYSIPTAVAASAIYLHNRYFQLSQLLEKRHIPYNSDILWLFATMAYNKGSRSVLNLWNMVYRKKGPEHLKELLNNYDYFQQTTNDSLVLTKSLRRIWEEDKAKSYATELKIHTKNISACAVSPLFQTTRSLTGDSQ